MRAIRLLTRLEVLGCALDDGILSMLTSLLELLEPHKEKIPFTLNAIILTALSTSL